jgi:pimeloyl-ACP methyl ester carboxylesterase
MARDVLALITHLQWQQCHVVGISMGGMISLEFALLAPEKILSLTLLATHAGGLSSCAPMTGIYGILRSLTIRDQHQLIENALTMLYGKKILLNAEKRKVSIDTCVLLSTMPVYLRFSTIIM